MKFTTLKQATKDAGASIVEETLEVSKITAGQIAYNNAKKLLAPIMPTIPWYERLFTSGKRREMIEMLMVYTLIHMFKSKFDNYATESITRYINYTLQSQFLSQFKSLDLDNLFKLKQ